MIRIIREASSGGGDFFASDDTAVGLDIGQVFGSGPFAAATDRGAMRPLMKFWSTAVELCRFAFEPWEIETVAEWDGEPGSFVTLLTELGYLVPFGDRLRIAGAITEHTRIGCGLAAVMDADMHRRVDETVRARAAALGGAQ